MSSRARVDDALRRLAEVDRPEVWISLADPEALRAQASEIDARVADGEHLPLAGTIVAVKDNIDVAGFDTTAGSPGAAYRPAVDSGAVARLRAAGALIMGKTNLDQFATGLVGSRSPYGAVRAAFDPTLVSGGSSAGSAVAVALGIVDAALGTDTAGSGRVPAAFNGIVGVKPTLGLVPITGVVPAAASYDAVTVFARDLTDAERFVDVMVGFEPGDAAGRAWPAEAPLAAPPHAVLAVPTAEGLEPMDATWRAAFEATVADAAAKGFEIVEFDIAPLLEVARLLYGDALVAERTAAFGHLLDLAPETVDPTVDTIVRRGEGARATALVADQQRLRLERARLAPLWERVTAMLLPTAPGHPSLAEVAADPIGRNAWVGTYTNFVNLLDLAALAVPGVAPVGVTLVGPAHTDRVLLDLAARLADAAPASTWVPEGARIAVFGAHLQGQPLNPQLTSRGARLLGPVRTSPDYRMLALDTVPAKPGLVRTANEGVSIVGEEWVLPAARLGDFLSDLASPMTVGKVTLDDGRTALGFLCEPWVVDGAADVSSYGGWAAYRAAADQATVPV